jgi:hypothetical protein
MMYELLARAISLLGGRTGNGLPATMLLIHVRRVSMKFGVGGFGVVVLLMMMFVVLLLSVLLPPILEEEKNTAFCRGRSVHSLCLIKG